MSSLPSTFDVPARAPGGLPVARERVTAAAPLALLGAAWLALYWGHLRYLGIAWWTVAEAGHGLLLVPIALYLAWRAGPVPLHTRMAGAQRKLGLVMLAAAVALRGLSALAAEPFTGSVSLLLSLLAIVVHYAGWAQVRRWWLPFVLLALSIPLPELILASLALPLQFVASRMGAALLEWRGVPVLLNGNIIRVPGNDLFVTEACSGLRSLTALISMGVLLASLFTRTVIARASIILLAIPVAIVLNGMRVFLTGYLVFFVDPALGKGFMHTTEGWLVFQVALAILALLAWGIRAIERSVASPSPSTPSVVGGNHAV